MKASVIIPCWNVAPYLARAITSVMAALPDDGEVLAIDDGSTDGTLKELQRLAAEYPRLIVIGQSHRGVSAARNQGLSRARGEYVFFVDPDDEVRSEYCQTMIARMEQRQADFCLVGFEGMPLKHEYECASREQIIAEFLPRIFGYSLGDLVRVMFGRPLFAERELASCCRGCFRRAIIERGGLRFDERISLYEDAMFLTEYLLNCQSMTSLPTAPYVVHEREDSASRRIPQHRRLYLANKRELMRKRRELDEQSGGRLRPLYAGTRLAALFAPILPRI